MCLFVPCCHFFSIKTVYNLLCSVSNSLYWNWNKNKTYENDPFNLSTYFSSTIFSLSIFYHFQIVLGDARMLRIGAGEKWEIWSLPQPNSAVWREKSKQRFQNGDPNLRRQASQLSTRRKWRILLYWVGGNAPVLWINILSNFSATYILETSRLLEWIIS